MKLLLLIVLTWSISTQDLCKSSSTQRNHGDCCNIANSVAFTSMFFSPVCRQLVPWPSGSPTNTSHETDHHVCRDECIFSENHLLTPELELDITRLFETFTSSDQALRAVLNSSVESCVLSYKSGMRQTSKCLSGAHEFSGCVFRDVFVHCPVKLWMDDKDCNELKRQAEGCPGIQVKLWKRGPPRYYD